MSRRCPNLLGKQIRNYAVNGVPQGCLIRFVRPLSEGCPDKCFRPTYLTKGPPEYAITSAAVNVSWTRIDRHYLLCDKSTKGSHAHYGPFVSVAISVGSDDTSSRVITLSDITGDSEKANSLWGETKRGGVAA
ncbi:hypothetical protein ACJJTC_001453 [Scirpophaga incertulas]